MTPTDLRALAARVLGEEPSETLLIEVRDAAFPAPRGYGGPYERWQHKVAALGRLIRGGHRFEFAFAMIPAGWRILAIEQTDEGYTARIGRGIFIASNCYTPVADLPRAVTAAGLMARAAEMEAINAE